MKFWSRHAHNIHTKGFSLHIEIIGRVADSVQLQSLLPLLSLALAPSIRHAILFVHHSHDHRLVGLTLNGCNGNVSDCSEVTAIVQMFILKAEIVPDEATKDLERSEDREHNVRVDVAHFDERHGKRPSKAQNEILNHCDVVEPLGNLKLIVKMFDKNHQQLTDE